MPKREHFYETYTGNKNVRELMNNLSLETLNPATNSINCDEKSCIDIETVNFDFFFDNFSYDNYINNFKSVS